MTLLSAQDRAVRRTIDAHDIFFSTTDAKGVITYANDTFMRLAALEGVSAIGSPHNVIRHPDMPGGLFRVMWDELGAGRPVCAYTANRALDGTRYDVFATVTPIDEGFLSIRIQPGVARLEETVFAAYQATSRHEEELRSQGHSRHSAAEQGAAFLLARFGEAGFASAADFTRAALPMELETLLRHLSVPTVSAPLPSGVRAGDLVSAMFLAKDVASRANGYVDRVADYEVVAAQVAQHRGTLGSTLDKAQRLADDLHRLGEVLARAVGEGGELHEMRELTARMVGWIGASRAGLEGLPGELTEIQTLLRDLALRIAVFVLLSHTVAQFTLEVASSGGQRGAELRMLHRALVAGLDTLEQDTEALRGRLSTIPSQVEEAVLSAKRVQLRVETWHPRMMAVLGAEEFDTERSEALARLDSVRHSLAQDLDGLDEIAELSTLLRRTSLRLDTGPVRSRLEEIGGLLAALP